MQTASVLRCLFPRQIFVTLVNSTGLAGPNGSVAQLLMIDGHGAEAGRHACPTRRSNRRTAGVSDTYVCVPERTTPVKAELM